MMGTISRYSRKVVTVPLSAPKPAKKAQPIMLATRSGTIVCVSRVATKKMAPTSANMLARLMLCEQDFQHAVEDRVVGDVVGIEADLHQHLGDAEIVGRRIENAVQRRGHVCIADHRISLGASHETPFAPHLPRDVPSLSRNRGLSSPILERKCRPCFTKPGQPSEGLDRGRAGNLRRQGPRLHSNLTGISAASHSRHMPEGVCELVRPPP